MPLSINTNIASMTAQRSFLDSNNKLEQAFERLSSGKRINSAVDDAAGLAIGKDLESRVRGLNQAIRNVNDGISMVQITEGALDEVTTILQRMRDISVQAANGSLSSTERAYLDTEQSKLATSLDTVLGQAVFSSVDLVGTSSTTVTIQSGAESTDTTDITIDALSADTLAVPSSLSMLGQEVVTFGSAAAGSNAGTWVFTDGTSTFTTASGTYTSLSDVATAMNADTNIITGTATKFNSTFTASVVNGEIVVTYKAAGNQTPAAGSYGLTTTSNGTDGANPAITMEGGTYGLSQIDAALATVASDRATLGATQSQLESMVRNLANVAENTAAAAGRIMDTDYAAETANLTKAQILQQAATSVLAQANAQPQAVLSLLQ